MISAIVLQEKAAWQAYGDYLESQMPVYGKQIQRKDNFVADDESRRLFTAWRTLRNERDGISNPRHKANRQHGGRFSTR